MYTFINILVLSNCVYFYKYIGVQDKCVYFYKYIGVNVIVYTIINILVPR